MQKLCLLLLIVCVTLLSAGISIAEDGDFENVELLGSIDYSFSICDLTIDGNYVYIISTNDGLKIVDISDPSSPVEVAAIETADGYDVFVDGDYAYIASGDGLKIVDISDPSNPVEMMFNRLSPGANGVAVSGDYACVVCGFPGLMYVIDISIPSAPVVSDSCGSIGYSKDVVIEGDYAFVSSGTNNGLFIIDIANPFNPLLTGSCFIPGIADEVVVNGNYAYLANGPEGMNVIDISNLNNPFEISTFPTTNYYSGISISNNRVFLSNSLFGLRVVDVADPFNPTEVGYYDVAGSTRGVVTENDYAYVITDNSFMIFDCSQATVDVDDETGIEIPSEFAIASAYPNPFNPTLNLCIALPETGNLEISVYNVVGQKVATLSDGGQYSAGIHNFIFKANDLTGLPSGVYFVQASVGDKFNQIKKVVLMK